MVYQFDTDIAATFGVEEAIMIYNFAFWIRKNEANGRHFYDGRYWTYNSVEALTQLFPFWSARQIRRILKSLEDKGVIVTGNYNQSAYDRTTWYAFGNSFLRNGKIHLTETSNGDAEKVNSINNRIGTDINTVEKPYNTADGGLFPNEPVKVEKKQRGTTEPLCLFVDSKYFDYEKFAACFDKDKFAGIDIEFYYGAVARWSASGGKKKRDWIATTVNFMNSDYENNKLHRLQSAGTGGLSPDAIEYLQSMGEGLEWK